MKKPFTFVHGDTCLVTLSLRRVLKRLKRTNSRSFTYVQDDKDIVTLSLRRVLSAATKLLHRGDTLYYVYILANWNNKVLYTGVTGNLKRRIYEHKNKLADGFTNKYNVDKLVYYDSTDDVREAIKREKEIKGWKRIKKDDLVSMFNPEWRDLSEDIYR
jgi:putative endonuclease